MATVQYNAQTGKKLASGEKTTDASGNTYTQGQTFTSSGGSSSGGSPIARTVAGYSNPNNLTTQQVMDIQKANNLTVDGIIGKQTSPFLQTNKIDTPILSPTNQANKLMDFGTNLTTKTDYSSLLNAISPYNQDGTPKTRQEVQNTQDNLVVDYLKSLNEPMPSSADALARATKESDILARQQVVGNLTSQLGQITSQGQAAQLSLVGQGRGIPEAIIGGQQAQIARETAIQALPIAAQLEAAQGNLEMANQNLDRLFKIYSEDAQNEYNRKTKMRETIFNIATKKEQDILDRMQKEDDRKYQETQALNDERLNSAKMAFANNQSSLGSQISALDYKSPTFKQDLAKLQAKLYDPMAELDRQIKQAQLNKLKTESTTGGTTATTTPQPLNDLQKQALNSAKALYQKFQSGVGTAAVGKSAIFSTARIPGTAAADFRIQFDNLKSLLSLDNVKLLKGQGAVSDAERQLLADASTKLNRFMTEDEFGKTLEDVITVFQKATPEYQYIDNITGVIDSSSSSLSASQYANSILNQ